MVGVGDRLAMLLSGARNHSVIWLEHGLLTQTKEHQNRQAMGCIVDHNDVIGMNIFRAGVIYNVIYYTCIETI